MATSQNAKPRKSSRTRDSAVDEHENMDSQNVPPESSKSAKSDGSSGFLRAARNGNYEKVLDYLKSGKADIDTCNANGLNALHLSSKEGYVNIVTELLNRGSNVNAASKKGNTALHISSLAGQTEVVKVLIQYGAKVNVQSQSGFTPLYMAAQENHHDIVRHLLDKGANANIATEDGFTPMAVALQQGHTDVVNVLMESSNKGKVRLSALHVAAKKDDVKAATLLLENEQNSEQHGKTSGIVNEPTKSGFTPLHIAAHYGNHNIASLLISKGANVNYKARNSIYPLHVASKWGRKNVVLLLLDNNATVDCQTRDGLTPLHCAARSGHDLIVDLLLERGAPVSSRTKNGLTALHMATQGDHIDCARILISFQAPVDDVTVDYLTPLHVAAHCGNVGSAKLLLDRNCEVNARALNGFTPLHIACKKNRIKVIELLLQYGAFIGSTTESGLTPLHVAAFMGYLDIVNLLLRSGCDPNASTVRGETALHLATRANQIDVMKLLLRSGAQVDARAKELQTALHVAARNGSTEAVQVLLSHDADRNAATKELYTPLHIAAKEGHDDVIQLLLDKGADQKLKTLKGFTPLHIAAKYGNVKVAQVLIQNGGNPNIEGKNGLTPLHVATHYNQVPMVHLLLEKGASPHAMAKNGYTPLHIAAKKNEMDVATALLEYHAQPDAESRNGFTPLHLATQEGHTDMVALLLQHGARVNYCAKNGLTPMHLAAQEDHVPVAEILVQYHSQIDPQTKAGYTPLHTACHFGQLNMIRFLLEHGASVTAVTKAGYTPLHQAAQQGHVLVINLLLRYHASPDVFTANGQTPLSIAQRLGFISVVEILKHVTTVTATTTIDEKYKVMSPEVMQEAAMSDEEDDDEAEETHLADQSYQYLTTGDDMRGLQDDLTPTGPSSKERDSFPFEKMSDRNSYGSTLPRGLGAMEEDMHYTHDDMEIHSDSISPHYAERGAIEEGQRRILAPSPQLESDIMDLGSQRPLKKAAEFTGKQITENTSITTKFNTEYKTTTTTTPKKEKKKLKKNKPDQYRDETVLETNIDTDMYRNDTNGFARKNELDKVMSRPPKVNGQPPPIDEMIKSPDFRRNELSATPDHLKGSADYRFDSVATTPDYTKGAAEYKYDLLGPTDNLEVPGMPPYKSNMSDADSRNFGSTYSGVSYTSSFDPDNVTLARQPVYSGFLVSFMVDARGGAMRGCRHSGIRIIVPPGRASMPTRVTCKLVRKEKLPLQPPLMEGEALASRVLIMGPAGAKFLGPVVLEVPHFASMRGLEREITVLRSDDGQTWREHSDLATVDTIQKTLCGSFEGEDLESAEDLYHRRIVRIVTGEFPKYFALVTRVRQDTGIIGSEGGSLSATVDSNVRTIFPAGALTKAIRIGLQAQQVSDDTVLKTVGDRIGVSPIVTIEPRRRKFHRPITVTIPLPAALHGKQPGDRLPTLRLLCSITGANAATDWEDITSGTPMTLNNNCMSFTTNVSARFWLIHCPNYKESVRIGTELFAEAIIVPFMANFVVFGKCRDPTEGQLRVFCMTDDKMDKTLESQEKFVEIARSKDVEVLDSQPQFIECYGNLFPFSKSDKDRQLYINFRAFKENRQSMNVRVRDPNQEPTGVLAFMAEPATQQGQTPISSLTVTLPLSSRSDTVGKQNGETTNLAREVADLRSKIAALENVAMPEDESISKAELRLTDIAEYLDDDWILLARQLNITRQEIIKIQSEYSYVTEQALVMLHLWIEKNKDAATGNALERALKTIGREDIIQRCIFTLKEVTDDTEKQTAKEHLDPPEDQIPSFNFEAAKPIEVANNNQDQNNLDNILTAVVDPRRGVIKSQPDSKSREFSSQRQDALNKLADRLTAFGADYDPANIDEQDNYLQPDGDFKNIIESTKTPPSTPAEIDDGSSFVAPQVTEDELVANFAKRENAAQEAFDRLAEVKAKDAEATNQERVSNVAQSSELQYSTPDQHTPAFKSTTTHLPTFEPAIITAFHPGTNTPNNFDLTFDSRPSFDTNDAPVHYPDKQLQYAEPSKFTVLPTVDQQFDFNAENNLAQPATFDSTFEPVAGDSVVGSSSFPTSFSDHFAKSDNSFEYQYQPPVELSPEAFSDEPQSFENNPFRSEPLLSPDHDEHIDPFSEEQNLHVETNPFKTEIVQDQFEDSNLRPEILSVVEQQHPVEYYSVSPELRDQQLATNPFVNVAKPACNLPIQPVAQDWPLPAAETREWQADFSPPQPPICDDEHQPLIADLQAEYEPFDSPDQQLSTDLYPLSDLQPLPAPETSFAERQLDAPSFDNCSSSLSPHDHSGNLNPVNVDTSFEDWVERNEMSCAEPTTVYDDEVRSSGEIDEAEEDDAVVDAVVRREMIEGELEVKIELDDDEQTLEDGTVLQRQIITRNFILPTTDVTNTDGIETDWMTVDRLVRIEIEETILELPPGVSADLDDRSDLETQVKVTEHDEHLEDGTPVRRKITRTTVVPVGRRRSIGEEEGYRDTEYSHPVEDLDAAAPIEYDDPETEVATLRVYTDTLEGEPEVETEEVENVEETLDDGTVVRRRVIKTRQKQTIIKRVVMEGPEDELPTTEQEAQEMLRQADYPGADDQLPPELIQHLDNQLEPAKTNVEEFEETLDDGTIVKRRIVTTTQQQLTTERVVLEGDVSFDDEYPVGGDQNDEDAFDEHGQEYIPH